MTKKKETIISLGKELASAYYEHERIVNLALTDKAGHDLWLASHSPSDYFDKAMEFITKCRRATWPG